MKKHTITNAILAMALMGLTACSTHYKVADVSRSRILIDNRFDRQDNQLETFIAPYRAKVDSIMSPVVGSTARALESHQPESPLSNLLADILIWAAEESGEKPDFSVYNVGGIRASFAQGQVTYGDVLDVAPFENRLCFLSLTGDKVEELFKQMASYGGQGVSHGVEARMDSHRNLTSLKINGSPVDKNKTYRIATLDYLAEGNDKLEAFKSKTDVKDPVGKDNTVRVFIIKYFKSKAAEGKAVDAQVEGRFVKEN